MARVAYKHRLHHIVAIVRGIKVWQLLILLALLAGASAYFLRQNSLEMVNYRNAVKDADENGGDTKKALRELQNYVTNHMNTSLGDGIVLHAAQKRAYDVAASKAADVTNPASQIYTQVELECRPVFKRTHSFPAYTQCAREKLAVLMPPGQDPLASLQLPSADLFKYNFLSPLWSPDLAGFSVLATILVGLTILARLVTYLSLRAILRRHQ